MSDTTRVPDADNEANEATRLLRAAAAHLRNGSPPTIEANIASNLAAWLEAVADEIDVVNAVKPPNAEFATWNAAIHTAGALIDDVPRHAQLSRHVDGTSPGYHLHYVSTYCIHGHHLDCRNTCKVCHSLCRCECHSDGTSLIAHPHLTPTPHSPHPW